MFANHSELGKITSSKKVYRKTTYKRSNIRTATKQKRFYAPKRRYYRFGEADYISDNQLMVYYDNGQMLGLGEYELGKLRFKKIFKVITKPVAKIIKPVIKVAKKIAPFTLVPVTGGASLWLSKGVRKGVKKVVKGVGGMFRKPKGASEEIAPSSPSIETSMVQAPMQNTQEMQNPSIIQSADRTAAAELEPIQQDISTEEEQPMQAGLLGKVNTPVIIGLTTIVALVGYSLLSSPKKGRK